jgi:hypothetical protein
LERLNNQFKNNMLDITEKKGNRSGRVAGTGSGQQLVKIVRQELTGAFAELRRRKKPLHLLLADQIEVDASKTLNLMGKFLPQQLNMDAFGSEFKTALEDVANRISEQNMLLKEQQENTITVEADKDKGA